MPSVRSSWTHDVITVGSAVVDSYASSPLFELERANSAPSGWNACVPLGAKIILSDMQQDTGGGATNAAVTFARLGFKTSTICRVGSDLFGDYVIAQLKRDGVDTHLIQRDPDESTGQSIILISGSGERTVLVHRAASDALNPKAVSWSKLRPRWFYVTSLGGDLGFLSLILDHAERTGARVAWNPGSAELEKGLQRLQPFIKRVDIFDVNSEEAALLTNKPRRHLSDIMGTLNGLPKAALLISAGQEGAYFNSLGCTWFAPGLAAKRINTTGAGDAFGSGFVAGFLHTCDPSVGFKVGMLNAMSVITHMGAKRGILRAWPSAKELARVKIKPVKW
jgi:ribokinase